MRLKIVVFPALILLGLAACQPQTPEPTLPTPTAPYIQPTGVQNPYAPQDADIQLERADIFLNSVDLSLSQNPPGIALLISGILPTPCHQLRVKISPPDTENNIHVEAYSLYKDGQICVQVAKEFNTRIIMGAYPDGHYKVFVNGQYLGDFTQP